MEELPASVAKRVEGAQAAAAAVSVEAAATASASRDFLVASRLRQLVSSGRVFLAIKGKPTQPEDEFSGKLVEVVTKALGIRAEDVRSVESNAVGAELPACTYFDVTLDWDVRQNLKALFDFPVYPQFYAGGKLIGGMDQAVVS